MKKTIIYLTMLITGIILSGCTDNMMTKQFGGNMTVNVPSGKKVVNATWKQDGSLWYFSIPRNTNEAPVTSEFIEKSSYGMMEGKVIFIEH